MAKVLISFKVFPSDINVDLGILTKKIQDNLPKYASIFRFEEEPIAFGLVAIIVHILLPEEKSGGIDEVESSIRNIQGINDLQSIMVRRI